MRVVLHSPEKSWELDWGISTIGSDPSCEIRLPGGNGVPPVAGVIVRWLEALTVLGVGPVDALMLGGASVTERKLDLRSIAASDLYGRWGAGGIKLSVGPHILTLAVENVPHPARAADFNAADLEAVMRAAMAHTLRAGSDAARLGNEDTLPELVARMAGCMTARFDPPGPPPGEIGTVIPEPPREAGSPVTTQTMILRSIHQSWEARTLTLSWKGPAPQGFVAEQQAAGIASTLEDTARALAEGRHAKGDPPAYVDAYLEMPPMRQKCGPYVLLGPDDFDHLGLPRDTVRAPQLVVCTIGGKVELVDLSAEPQLMVSGIPVRRVTYRPETALTIFGTSLKVTPVEDKDPELAMPGRVFRHLALWTDPVTQIARLGLLLPHLRSRTEQRMAYMLAAVSGVRGAGIVGAAVPRVGARRFTPMMMRWGGESLLLYGFPYCRVIETALRRALDGGGELVSPNALLDTRLFDPDDTPADHTAASWGPLVVLTLDSGEALICWKHRWNPAFTPEEITLLRAILRGMKTDGVIPPQDLARWDLPPQKQAAPGGAALRLGRMRLPLDDVTVVGSSPRADVRVVLDPSLSSRHLLLVREGDGHRMFDLRSFNGVTVDDQRVNEVLLEPDKDYDVASTRMRYEPSEAAAAVAVETAFLPEDVELEPDPVQLKDAIRLVQLGHDLLGTDDPVLQGRWYQVTGAALLDCHLHLVEMEGMGLPLKVHGSTAPMMPDPEFFALARPLVASCLQVGRPVSSSSSPLVAAPVPALSAGQGRPLAMVFSRPAGLTPERVREIWAFASLLAHSPLTTRVHLEHGAQRVALDRPLWIGRAKECDLVLDHSKVSRKHVLVVPGRGTPPFVWAIDFNSEAGIAMRGQKADRFKLRDGDAVEIAGFRVIARVPELPLDAARTQRLDLLERARSLIAIGRKTSALELERMMSLTEHLRVALGVPRVLIVGARDEVLAGSSHPEMASAESAERFVAHAEVQQLLRQVRRSQHAAIRTLEPARIYRKAEMMSIQMVMPLVAKTALGVPFGPGDPHVLVVASLRTAPVAFTAAQLALAAAVLAARRP